MQALHQTDPTSLLVHYATSLLIQGCKNVWTGLASRCPIIPFAVRIVHFWQIGFPDYVCRPCSSVVSVAKQGKWERVFLSSFLICASMPVRLVVYSGIWVLLLLLVLPVLFSAYRPCLAQLPCYLPCSLSPVLPPSFARDWSEFHQF